MSENENCIIETNEMFEIAISDRPSYAEVDDRLVERAIFYIETRKWCKKLLRVWLNTNWDDYFAVFYMNIIPDKPTTPEYIWIVIGDLPSAYIYSGYCKDAYEVMKGYVFEMQKWVDRVMNDIPLDETIIPVNVPPEKYWAQKLHNRLEIIREDILDQH